jgi:hypothetical protein
MIITFDDNSFTDKLVAKVDAIADRIRLRVVGDPVRIKEYETAEAEASEYKAAGYPTDAPPTVKSWAEAKSWTNQQAADDILAAADRWHGAMYYIRDARLKAKEAIRNATTSAQKQSIYDTYEASLTQAMAGVQ